MPHVPHPRFDLPFFEALFSLDSLREKASERAFLMPKGQIVTSPFHLTVVELLRREVLGATMPVGATPVDVFVFGTGEPSAPYLTKIGGAPFRSRHKPWPRTKDGRPLGFVGQVSFVDSGDVVARAPGDVLLVFADPENLLSTNEYVLEWVGLDEEDPMSRGDMPDVRFTTKPGRVALKRGALPETRSFDPFVCHGVIHRTVDLVGSEALFGADEQPYRVGIFEATKIGGIPHGIQAGLEVVGRFVASVASIQPAPDVAYPWTNQPAPLSLAARHAIPTWKLGDMGSLYIFEKDGRVRLDAQSY